MKTGIIIQARSGSTRLPNKMILPFYKEKGVLELLLEKITLEFPEKQIILATTTNLNDNKLVNIANKFKINIFRGSEDNVLDRFIKAAEKYSFSNIIRVCADNPFLDIPHIHILIDEIETNQWDYVSYKTETGLPTIKSHLGLFTEAVTLKALKTIPALTSERHYFEHVTNYIYSHNYQLNLLNLPEYFNNTNEIRLTLDTIEDFDFQKKLYAKVKDYSTEQLIDLISKDELLLNKMKHEILRHHK